MSESALQITHVPEAAPAPAEPAHKPVAVSTARLLGVDALRGLALVLMSLDHAAYYVSVNIQGEHFSDFPSFLPGWALRIIGLLTNLASPAFWLVSGISVALLARTLRRQGGGEWAVTRFLWIRAGLLFLLDVTVVPFLWSKSPIPTYEYVFSLLSSFGVSLLLLSGLRFLRLRYLLVISLACVAGYEWIAHFADRHWVDGGLLTRIWATYGTPGHTEHHLAVPFPVLGWFGLMGAGYVLGKRLRTVNGRRPGVWVAIGLGLLLTWVAVRALNGYGNQIPIPYRADWGEFVTMFKGPVSLAYMAFNLSLACFIFSWLLRHPQMLTHRPWRWMVVLGQASLYVYLIHMLVYRTIGRLDMHLFPWNDWVRFGVTFVAGIALMVPMAQWYRDFKRRHPGSVLQYL
jgi:uncharacterized membrane protein